MITVFKSKKIQITKEKFKNKKLYTCTQEYRSFKKMVSNIRGEVAIMLLASFFGSFEGYIEDFTPSLVYVLRWPCYYQQYKIFF